MLRSQEPVGYGCRSNKPVVKSHTASKIISYWRV